MSDLFGKQEHKVKSKADVSAETLNKIKAQLEATMRGEADPVKLRKKMEKAYQDELRKFVFPGAGDVPGRKLLKIVYRQGDGSPVKLYWDYLPYPQPTVLGLCPACYMSAPAHVSVKDATQPIMIDGYLNRLQGNPEADRKVGKFALHSPHFTITVNDKLHLTIRERVRCPECGWTVQIEDGIATKVSRLGSSILTGNERKAVTGPIIKVR